MFRSDDCRDDQPSKPSHGTTVRKPNPGKHSMGMDNADHQASKPAMGTMMRSRPFKKHEKGNVASPMMGTVVNKK